MVDIWPPPTSRRIDLAEEQEFDLGHMRVVPAERSVVVNGDRRELQPRIMQVLVALAKTSPDVLSRDKLVELCWDGRIVGDDALNRCILTLRHLAQDFNPQPFSIETVPRIGHRLLRAGEGNGEGAGRSVKSNRRPLAALLAVLLIVMIGGFVTWQQQSADAGPASIAVLPFRNLSGGDSSFAEGIGEEILGQLAREPAFHVSGRASATQFKSDADPRDVGRKLGVDYLLEGSVRSDGARVRISASLITTKDGMRLWSETYDRPLENILAIQASIGQAVATELKRRLVHSPVGRLVNPRAYTLYLNARGLLRSGNPQSGDDAVALLQEAVRIDPQFAPAWSSLAEALNLNGKTKGNEGLIANLPKAQAAARRALQLDPNLPDAHGVYASVIGADSPEGIAHLGRAAALSPRSAEGLHWRGVMLDSNGEFEKAIAAFERARELDPLWPLPTRVLIDSKALMGDRRAAEQYVRQALAGDEMLQRYALARVAWLSGDYSEAARGYSIVANGPSPRWASPARLTLEDVLFMLKLSDKPPSRPPLPFVGPLRFGPRIWTNGPPLPAEWQHRNRSQAAALVYWAENDFAAKQMLNAGRARELVATYDSPVGLLGIRRGEPILKCRLHEAPTVVLALRSVGRFEEADAIIRQSDAVIRRVYRGGKVPSWFEDDAAAVWAVQGNRDAAVEALERAFRRGWVHAGRTDLLKIEDEPALRSLRGHPRFDSLVAKYAAHMVKERQETARALKLTA